jgi:hypothetical protein
VQDGTKSITIVRQNESEDESKAQISHSFEIVQNERKMMEEGWWSWWERMKMKRKRKGGIN